MYNYEDIKSIHLEVTQNCQAACPMCDRNMNGEGVNPHINLDELSLDDCIKISVSYTHLTLPTTPYV